MAIKLQGPEGSGNALPGAAQQARGVQAFGQQGITAANLPQENAGANVSAALQTAAAQQNLYDTVVKSASSLITQLEGHRAAEDDTISQKFYAEAKAKREEIKTRNYARAGKCEITLMTWADENDREFNEWANERLSGLTVNNPQTRDTLSANIKNFASMQYSEDQQAAIRKNTEEKSNAYLTQLQSLQDLAEKGPAGVAEAKKRADELKANPMAIVVGPDRVASTITTAISKGASSAAINAIKADPSKFLEQLKAGDWDVALAAHTPEEIEVYRQEAENQVKIRSIRADEDRNRTSETVYRSLELAMAKGNTVTKAEILGNPVLNDHHKTMLLNRIAQDEEAVRQKGERLNFLGQKYKLGGNSYMYMSPSEQAEYMILTAPGLMQAASKDQTSALQVAQTIKAQNGTIPDGIVLFAVQPPANTTDKKATDQWATNVITLTQSIDPTLANNEKVKQPLEIALRMKNFDESYEVAKQRVIDPESRKKLTSEFDPTLWKADSAFKDPAKFIAKQSGYSRKDIPLNLQAEYKEAIKLETMFGGSQEEIAKRAYNRLNVGVFKLPNGRELLIKDPPKLQEFEKKQFDKQYTDITKKYGIKEGSIVKKGDTVDGVPVYQVLNDLGLPIWDSNNRPVLIEIDRNKYRESELNQQIKQQSKPAALGGGIAPSSRGSTVKLVPATSPEGLKLSKIESQYPNTVGKNPGILRAIYAIESANGTQLKSPAGAEGPFQFMPDTARALGVKNTMDFDQSAAGAAKYMDQLINRYKGNVEHALMAYNWGPGNVDRWIRNGQKIGFIPQETKAYVAKAKSYIGTLNG